MLESKIYNFNDDRGQLSVVNEPPFEVKRFYWIKGKQKMSRGFHSHKTTRQVIYHIHGVISYFSKAKDQPAVEKALGEQNHQCVYVPPLEYHWLEFHTDGVLLVIADKIYERDDYIFD